MDFAEVFSKLGLDWRMILFSAANFVIFFLILKKFVIGPVAKTLDEREEKIEKSLRDAEQLEKELAEAKAKSQQILKEASEGANDIIENAKAQALAEKARIEAEAKRKIEEIENSSKIQLQKDKDKMIAQIKADAAELTIQATEKILEQKINAQKDKELIEDYLSKLNVQ